MSTIDCPACGHEHIPTGSHEDDVGEHECEKCGFEFVVEIDYDPIYDTHCQTCDFTKEVEVTGYGKGLECRYCGAIKLLGEENER